LDPEAESAIAALGFHRPTAAAGEAEGEGSANFFVDVPVLEADRLAVMAVRALRDVFGVAHPAFLSASGLEVDPDVPSVPSEPAIELDEPASVMPESAEHLRELVDLALTPLFGAEPEHDEDGDIPVPWGSSLVYVRVDEDAPVVELFSCVADGVTDLQRAAFEVNVLNRDARFIKFTLVADRVMARIHLPAWPFVPEHLRSMLTGMSAKIDDIDEDLVARVGGSRAIEEVAPDDLDRSEDEDADPDEELDELDRLGVEEDSRDASVHGAGGANDEAAPSRSELDVALLTLLQLDAEAVGSVDAELAASVCGFDKAVVLRLLGDTGRQEVAWSRARDRAVAARDSGEADACDDELRAWQRTTGLLRRALRLIVERQLGRAHASGGAAGAGDGADGDAADVPLLDGAPLPADVPGAACLQDAMPPRRVARKLFPARPPGVGAVEQAEVEES
jgi:hypothetical protein